MIFFCFKKAKYKISINANKTFKKFSIPIDCLSESIILGWFGHEIAHILQYEKMSYFEKLFFVFKYVFNKKFRKNFETKADEITKERGLEKELKEGINFTLTDPRVSNAYKKRTREFYSQI